MKFLPLTNSYFPIDQTFHHFITLVPNWTFSQYYEWYPWSICNGCGIPAGNANPYRHLDPSPHFGTFYLDPSPHFETCLCSNCWDRIPRTCHVFTQLFTSNTPWYFPDFAFNIVLFIFTEKLKVILFHAIMAALCLGCLGALAECSSTTGSSIGLKTVLSVSLIGLAVLVVFLLLVICTDKGECIFWCFTFYNLE